MSELSPSMLKTLRKLANGSDTAIRLRCPVATLVALERRKLICVETTFDSIAFPRKALAYITAAGMAWLRANKKIRIHRRVHPSTGAVKP